MFEVQWYWRHHIPNSVIVITCSNSLAILLECSTENGEVWKFPDYYQNKIQWVDQQTITDLDFSHSDLQTGPTSPSKFIREAAAFTCKKPEKIGHLNKYLMNLYFKILCKLVTHCDGVHLKQCVAEHVVGLTTSLAN